MAEAGPRTVPEVMSVVATGAGASTGAAAGGSGATDSATPSPVPAFVSGGRFMSRAEYQDDIDELDNLVSARDKLELYNMLALEKDIIIDKSCARESAIGRIYPARWLSAHVDVACLEINAEHLNTRQHALGGLINTALTLRKAVSKINHHYSTSRATAAQPTAQHQEELHRLAGSSPSKAKQTSTSGNTFRAHIQELLAMQLEPHLKIITSSMPNCTSIHQLIKMGQGKWTWEQRAQMLLQVSQGMSALHSQGVIHGNIRLANVYFNPALKRVVICGSGWDRLLPYDILNIHQADEPGSIRWTAPDCYQYIANLSSHGKKTQSSSAQPPLSPGNTRIAHRGNFSPQAPRRVRPHPPEHRSACDVFAFAVTMWEMADGTGQPPYSDLRYTREVVSFVQSNKRMFLPVSWPSDLRELIKMCWSGECSRRPNFSMISEALTGILLQHHSHAAPDQEEEAGTLASTLDGGE